MREPKGDLSKALAEDPDEVHLLCPAWANPAYVPISLLLGLSAPPPTGGGLPAAVPLLQHALRLHSISY